MTRRPVGGGRTTGGEHRGAAADDAGAPAFHVITPERSHPRALHSGGVFASWQATGKQLWEAWRDLDQWELATAEDLGAELGANLLVLWALRTFAGGSETLLAELIDDDAQPRFGDEILEDIAFVAFALGASWGASSQGDVQLDGVRRTVVSPAWRTSPPPPSGGAGDRPPG